MDHEDRRLLACMFFCVGFVLLVLTIGALVHCQQIADLRERVAGLEER